MKPPDQEQFRPEDDDSSMETMGWLIVAFTLLPLAMIFS